MTLPLVPFGISHRGFYDFERRGHILFFPNVRSKSQIFIHGTVKVGDSLGKWGI